MTVSTHDSLLELLKTSAIFTVDELKRAAELVDDQDDSKAAARKLVAGGLLTRWQGGQLLKPGKVTLALGKYVLLDRLPWGSSHAVFLAKHPTMDRKVALNVLDKTSSARGEAVKSFLADARAIASLDHRHLIHVYDIDKADDRYFLVMEHVEGRNLHDAVKASGRLSYEAAADIVRQIAEGLEHAHRSGLVHGGLRPSNVLLDTQGIVEIIDLGVSKFEDPTKPPDNGASDSQIMELANFLSPEQAAGKAATAQSDLYSLGCIGYLLLTGEPPFAHGDYAQRLANHQTETPPDLRTRRKETPDGLAAILQKLLSKEPSQRYGSAKEMVAALEQWWSKHAAQVEAAKPKPMPKPVAKAAPPKPAPGPAAKPAVKQATARPAVAEVEESAVPDFPSIQIAGTRKSSPMPVVKTASKPAGKNGAAFVLAASAPTKGKNALAVGVARKARDSAVIERENDADDAHVALSSATPPRASRLPILWLALGGALIVLLVLVGGGVAFFNFMGSASPVDVTANNVAAEPPQNDQKLTDGATATSTTNTGVQKSTAVKEPAVTGVAAGETNAKLPQPAENDVVAVAPTDNAQPIAPTPAEPAPPKPVPADKPPVKMPPVNKQPAPPKEKPIPNVPKPKPADPFAALAEAVVLPAEMAEQKEPFSLGEVKLPAETICYIDLIGGDKALPKEGLSFSMDLARNGLAEREWEVKLVGVPSGDVMVAQLALAKNQLQFKWLPAAAGVEEAGYLRNCQLNLRTADYERYLRLRKPEVRSALPINLKLAMHREEMRLPFAANPDEIKVQVLKVDGVDKAVIEGKQLAAKLDSTIIWFGEAESRSLGIKFDVRFDKELVVAISPVWNQDGTVTKPKPKELQSAELIQSQLTVRTAQLNKIVEDLKKRNGANGPQKGKLTDEIAEGQRQLGLITQAFDTLDKFKVLKQQLDAGNANVQYRVFTTDGENEVELVRADQAPVAHASGDKPNE